MNVFRNTIIFGMTTISFIFSLNAMAQGDLMITPRRLVFEGGKRSQDLNLANTGKDTATYAISFIQIRMREDGTFETIKEPDSTQLFADKYLRFFPRTVTLAPNEAQTVKVQIVKTSELTAGEYRSHLYFRAVPKDLPLGETEPLKDSGISVKLVPIFGISLPTIIRVGQNNSEINLSDVAFRMESDTIPMINFTINRSGNMSVYGDLRVDYVSLLGKVTRVGNLKGLAVYAPSAKRHLRLRLEKIAGIDYNAGNLRIVFSDPSSAKIAQQEFPLKASDNTIVASR